MTGEFHAEPAAREPLLRLRSVVKEYPVRNAPRGAAKTFRAVDEVDLELHRGETLAIVGESGSGKSTTARIAARLLEPSSGVMEFDGAPVVGTTQRQLRQFRSDVQVVFQDPFSSLNPRKTVEQIITAPVRNLRPDRMATIAQDVRDIMDRVGLNPDHAGRYPRQFSGGQAQRIGIARALIVDPKLVICDEAVSALDVTVQAQILALLKELQRERNIGYMFISHDMAVVRQVADRIAVMSKGSVVEQGPRDEVLMRPQHEYTKKLLSSIPRIKAEWDAARRAHVAAHPID